MNNTHTIEVIKSEGLWIAVINGVVMPHIKSPYKNVVRRNAAQYAREQAEKEYRFTLKELGL